MEQDRSFQKVPQNARFILYMCSLSQTLIGNDFYCYTRQEILRLTFNEEKTALKISARRILDKFETQNDPGLYLTIIL